MSSTKMSPLPAAWLLLAALILTAAAPGSAARAQELPIAIEMPVPAGVTYDLTLPSPEAVLGYRIGARHTLPHEIVDYFERVAAASPRVVVEEHGRTYEGRPLVHAIVTSPENHARLEAIRAANLRLSDAPETVSDAELEGMPAVVHMNYGIHGNEASGGEAAMLLLYHLAAGAGAPVASVLDSAVVIINPMLNPDGRDRFADWVNRNRGGVAVADPQDREHREAWPGGRTNHYWFDLNRDWLPLVHPESRGHVAVYHRWRPQVLGDFHEMGSHRTYFFMPGVPSRTNPLTPAANQELTAAIADYHARALDGIGSLYYSAEGYDDFYYGKGSTFPDAQGTVGILFEQASSRALERETENGLLTFAFTVRNQLATSLSTLAAAVDLRERLLRYQRDFYAEAHDWARSHPVKGFVVSTAERRTRAQALAALLQSHRVRVHALARDLNVEGRRFRAGEAFVVPMDQPQARFVAGVMETAGEFADSIFYDVSTWTLPLAYGVHYAELDREPGRALGDVLPPVSLDGGALVGGTAGYAYLLPWDRYYAPRALHRLQATGARARLMTTPFSADVGGTTMELDRGVVVIPVTQPGVDPGAIHTAVREAVERDHVRVYATDRGLTPAGVDLGTPSAAVLPPPRIALLTGRGASSYHAGATWHLLSERFRIPVSLLEVDAVGRADLDRYNTLVLAGGDYQGLDAGRVRDWARGGGRLIALGDATTWLVANGLLDAEPRELDLDARLEGVPYADLADARGAHVIGGAIFGIRLDATHPLAFGYDGVVPVFRDGEHAFDTGGSPGTVVARYLDEPLLSGYTSGDRQRQLAGSPAIVATRHGDGRIVAILDRPNFRGFWYGTNGLFLNAVFFGNAF
ncbi:MAG: M14 family zinc carboxypeptidase [Gemmatimonadota bacterium]